MMHRIPMGVLLVIAIGIIAAIALFTDAPPAGQQPYHQPTYYGPANPAHPAYPQPYTQPRTTSRCCTTTPRPTPRPIQPAPRR